MNKRYIDFVPSKSAKVEPGARGRVSDGVVHVEMPEAASRVTVRTKGAVRMKSPGRRIQAPARGEATVRARASVPKRKVTTAEPKVVSGSVTGFSSSRSNAPALGVVEDLNTKFVNTDVPKRPLSSGVQSAAAQKGLADAKAQKIRSRKVAKAPKAVAGGGTAVKASKATSSTFKTPRPTFINQEKIVKRPLSKNVYQKKTAIVSKAEPKGPVAIISTPKKESHVGVVVTIILTIILGAAAGTVAFLLLPK